MNKAALLFAVASSLSLPVFGAPAKPVFESKTVGNEPVAIRAELGGAKELYLLATDGGRRLHGGLGGLDRADAHQGGRIEAEAHRAEAEVVHGRVGKARRECKRWRQADESRRQAGGLRLRRARAVADRFRSAGRRRGAWKRRAASIMAARTRAAARRVVFKVFTQAPASEEGTVASKAPAGGGDRYGLEKAKANMNTFKTADGLKASLVAAEPMIQNPTNIDIDHRGRVWAVECVNYRKYGKIRPGGRSRRDPRRHEWRWRSGQGEDLLPKPGADESARHLRAAAGEGHEGHRERRAECLAAHRRGRRRRGGRGGEDLQDDGVWDYDHQIHAFVFGPDGKFYFNFGDAATSLTWPDGTVVKDLAGNEITNKGKPYRQGMVFRCDIDLATGKASNVETLGHNFRNNYEVDGRFLRHHVAVRQRRRRQQGRAHQLRDGVRQLRLHRRE